MEKKKSLVKTLLMVAIPIALQNLINVGVTVADTLMIGNIDEVQLSGISQANQPYFLFTTLIFGLTSGTIVLTAQYWGRKELEPIRALVGLMIRIGMVGGLLMSLFVLTKAEFIMNIYADDKEVIAYGVMYLKIVGYSYVFSAFTGVFLLGLRGVGNVKASMYIYGISFLFNLFLNWVFIFGNLGAPRLEIKGAAIATLISRILETILSIGYMYLVEKRLKFRFSDIFRKTRKYWRTLARYGGPALFSELNWGIGITVQVALIGHLGRYVLAAFSFINQVQQLASIAIIGIGVGSSIVVGNLIGEGREEEAKRLANNLVKVSFLIGAIMAAIAVLLRPIAPYMIQTSEETAEYIRSMLYVSAYMIFFESYTMVTMAGILRGAGDTIFCAVLDIGTLWLVKILLGIIVTYVLQLPPVWIYFVLCSDEFIKTLFTFRRVKRGEWIHDTTLHLKQSEVK